jgi:hypothetical protein
MMPDAELGREWLDTLDDETGDVIPRRSAFTFLSEHYLPEERLLFAFVFFVVPGLMLAGSWRFLRRHPAMWPVIAGGIAAPLVGYALHHWVLYTFIYYWYLIYAMPVVLALLGLGLEAAGEACKRQWEYRVFSWVPALVFIAFLVAVNCGGMGRMGWTQPPFTQPAVFDRGRFLWITYPDGRTLRVPDPNGK